MQWYYSKNGTQLGPVEEGELRAKLASGEISQADLVWKEGMKDWLPAAGVAELAPLSAFPTAPTGIPQGAGSSPYSPPMSASYVPPQPYYGPRIPTYLWQSIVVTFLCCLPLGIPAIVYAAKVDGLIARGDIQGAMAASASAKTWCNVSAGVFLLGFALFWVLGLLGSFA
jgi:hypothetical protein